MKREERYNREEIYRELLVPTELKIIFISKNLCFCDNFIFYFHKNEEKLKLKKINKPSILRIHVL